MPSLDQPLWPGDMMGLLSRLCSLTCSGRAMGRYDQRPSPEQDGEVGEKPLTPRRGSCPGLNPYSTAIVPPELSFAEM